MQTIKLITTAKKKTATHKEQQKHSYTITHKTHKPKITGSHFGTMAAILDFF